MPAVSNENPVYELIKRYRPDFVDSEDTVIIIDEIQESIFVVLLRYPYQNNRIIRELLCLVYHGSLLLTTE